MKWEDLHILDPDGRPSGRIRQMEVIRYDGLRGRTTGTLFISGVGIRCANGEFLIVKNMRYWSEFFPITTYDWGWIWPRPRRHKPSLTTLFAIIDTVLKL